jgi:acyl carrier protein
MAPADLKEKLRAVVLEIAEIDECPDDVPFKDLGIDSMMAIEIIAEVAEAELETVRDLNSVFALISGKL